MLQRRNLLACDIDLPWKTFVKESGEVSEKSVGKVHQLRFQGDEARAAYEEIVNQESSSNVQVEKVRHFKTRVFNSQNNSISKSYSANGKTKKSQSSEEIIPKITINTIFKAIEQRDLKFLSKHVTQENVNIVDDFGWTPLMSAAYCGYLDIVEFLLSLGANRKFRDKSGLTAAQLALKRNYLSIVALLKKRIESVSDKVSSDSNTGLSRTNVASHARSASVEPLKDSNGGTYKSVEHKVEQSSKDKGFYCGLCEANFHQDTRKKHEASVLHIFNTKPKLSSTMYGISKQNKGYQMLLNTGWDEQGGLGPSGKGIKYPIKTCFKTDRKGLGQSNERTYRITHFKPGDTNAINNFKIFKQKCLKKRDREKLLNREVRKERALRIALS